jgi:hypothetical protein
MGNIHTTAGGSGRGGGDAIYIFGAVFYSFVAMHMHLLCFAPFHSRGCVQLKHFPDTRASSSFLFCLQTDTASVLQETIGYIRFLLGQIEVQPLSLFLSHVGKEKLTQGHAWSHSS